MRSEDAQPLLGGRHAAGEPPDDTFWPSVANLSKVIIGAGMMAIPRAIYTTGSLLGVGMLVATALITYFTLAALLRGSEATGAQTYSQLTLTTCGRAWMKALQLAVLGFCYGFCVVYMVVIRDILLGTPPACNGLLCELLGLSPSSPLADPRLVVCLLGAVVFAPMLLLRSLDRLAPLNAVGIAAIAALACVAAALGARGLATGTAHALPALPQWGLLGPTRAAQLQALAAVLPVVIACYVAHQSLHPAMGLLRPYSGGRMRAVVAAAVGVSGGVFTTLAVGSVLVFGPETATNVLTNYSVSGLSPLVGAGLARALSYSIRLGYSLSLVASLLLYMHPMRGFLAEMLWPEGAGATGGAGEQPSGAAAVAAAAGAPTAAPAGAATESDPGVVGDDHRVLVAFDPTDDSPAYGSWKPGALPAWLGLRRSSSSGARPRPATAPPLSARRTESGGGGGGGAEALSAAAAAAGGGDGEGEAGGAAPAARWRREEQRHYYALTYGLLATMVITAVSVPDIWVALSAIGDLASTVQAFIVPGAIVVVLAWRGAGTGGGGSESEAGGGAAAGGASAAGPDEEPAHKGGCNDSAATLWPRLQSAAFGGTGAFVVLLGVALFVNGVVQRL